jgi:HAD superfamily hydrolase (TIGR01484 family)
MYFLALVTDYDGTIAHHGRVPPETLAALRRLKESGRRLILVTGRELEDLRRVLPEMNLFDRIVPENGGILFNPLTGQFRALAPSPSSALIETLMRRGVEPISVGHAVVATWSPHENAVLEAIEELGLELKIIFNKSAVMILPTGVDKATGLAAALKELHLSPLNAIGVGDAENDGAFLAACGCSAAVANALDTVRERCDIVLSADHGAGVAELVWRVLREDVRLASKDRLGLLLGETDDGNPIRFGPHRTLLVTGGSGVGKSSFATFLTERMVDLGAEFCIVDPEGDYDLLEDAVSVGAEGALPSDSDILALIERTGINLVLGLHASDVGDRRSRLIRLFPKLESLRANTGRPHWLIIDEAHQLLPSEADATVVDPIRSAVLITISAQWIAPRLLTDVDALMAFGATAAAEIAALASAHGLPRPVMPEHAHGEALYWTADRPAEACVIVPGVPRQQHHRHKGKYAIGDVGDTHAFIFRDGSGRALGRARNLGDFLSLMNASRDADWDRHLRSGDFTAWFTDVIRDEELGRCAMVLAGDPRVSASESRALIGASICERYAIPAKMR